MARVTVEDCIDKVQSTYELVLLAAQRAKDLNSGVPITIEKDNDKSAVIALREIASGNIKIDSLREELIERLQTTRNKIDYIDREDLHIEENNIQDFGYIPHSSDINIGDNSQDLDNDDPILFDDIADDS